MMTWQLAVPVCLQLCEDEQPSDAPPVGLVLLGCLRGLGVLFELIISPPCLSLTCYITPAHSECAAAVGLQLTDHTPTCAPGTLPVTWSRSSRVYRAPAGNTDSITLTVILHFD